jgi:hypothetical protein
MKSAVSNIESNLVALEKNIAITSPNRKCIIYSTVAAIVSIFVFRPLYIYRKDTVYNKNKKPIQEKYMLSYYRCVACTTVYSALFYLFFRYYVKI